MTENTKNTVIKRCKQCYYPLRGLPVRGVCPECGARYAQDHPNGHTLKPPFLWKIFWAPPAVAVIALCVALTGLMLYMGMTSGGLWIGTPLAIGIFSGYSGRIKLQWQIALGIFILLGVGFSTLALSMFGFFCAGIIVGIGMVPITIGAGIGAVIRSALKTSSFSQRAWLRALSVFLIPLAWGALDAVLLKAPPIAIVATESVVQASPAQVWDSLMFYEEVDAEPPLLLRIGLPTPIRAEGSMRESGDVKVCIYEKGELVKRITSVTPGRLVAFRVERQEIGFEKSVTLLGGQFEFAPVNCGAATKVRLVTEYQPHLTPRWVWAPIERLSVRTLHQHVLDGLARNTAGQVTEPLAVLPAL